MVCAICGAVTHHAFSSKVLRKYEANYQLCNACGYLQVSDPHWLEEAYSSAIASSDTGLVVRNLNIAKKLAGVLYWGVGDGGLGWYLDYAGGYGLLTRLMRDQGFDFYWQDKYCTNILATGFDFQPEQGRCSAVTAFEVLEHVQDPITFVRESLQLSGASTFVFSTDLYEGETAPPREWWYYSFETGQHIGFFQRRTLKAIADRLGMHFVSANGVHVFTSKRMTERQLSFLTGKFMTRFAPFWVRRRLGSKTLNDSANMLARV